MSDVDAQLAALKVEVEHLAEAVEKLTATTEKLTAQANRWKGAFGVVLFAGGLFGWLVNTLSDHLGAGS
ncbi:hypothetical protein CMI47_03600 [Candidatus Pacearchaeota archaeon]|jgi:hypothetical protein|nr:hypothetical protein [Candidatus Pacearchaeota archaeon]|tara:strand:+ start:1777 stop:1983 length:207 start_codon:yes stop_codon:yes gene_type:complete